MEAALNQTSKTLRRRTKREGFVSLGIITALFALMMLQRTTLVDPIDYRVTFLSGVTFFGVAAWWSLRLSDVDTGQPEWKKTLGRLVLPVLAIFVGTYLARAAVGVVAFAGVHTPFSPVKAHVTDFRSGKYGAHYATVSLGPDTREFEIKVSSELFQALDPWRQPGRDCIVLGIQKGRGGIRRTLSPNLSFDAPVGIDHYRVCDAPET